MGTDEQKIRCLFMVPGLLRGGAETQTIDLVNDIDSRKFDKYLLAFEKELDQLARVDTSTVKFHHVVRTGKYNLGFIKHISRVIDENKIDIIHCTLQISLLFAWLARLLSKRKPSLVIAIHTTVNVSRKNDLIDRLLYRTLIRCCDKVIFVCKTQQDYWIGRYPELKNKSVVIYNGVDTEKFDPDKFTESGRALRNQLKIPIDNPVIVCVAGFRKEKGHHILLKAFSGLANNVHLILAGDGVLRSAIEAKIDDLNLSTRVHLLGNVDDVRPVLAGSDISVLASTAVETFSIAMLESMAMKVPFISSDIGGLAEAILVKETGDIVPVNDIQALENTLCFWLKDKERLKIMGHNARIRVKEKFSKSAMVLDTERLLENVRNL